MLSETICEYFESLDYSITPVYDGLDAEALVYEQQFDLLILDVNVPGQDGFTLLQSLRENETLTPALFLTTQNQLLDMQKGYDSGCDEYISKPFLLAELKLRVAYLLKKSFFHAKVSCIDLGSEVSYEPEKMVLKVKEQPVHLQHKEHLLLKLLLQNRERVLTHEEINAHLWSFDEESSESALRTYIKNLRKHIGKDKIVSLKRIGYQYNP